MKLSTIKIPVIHVLVCKRGRSTHVARGVSVISLIIVMWEYAIAEAEYTHEICSAHKAAASGIFQSYRVSCKVE
jgi:hypothetical protein